MNTRRAVDSAKTGNTLSNVLLRADTITFDCYGTLIDWRAGVIGSLTTVFGEAISIRVDEVFQAYVATEAEVEAEGYQAYRKVVATAAQRTARRLGLDLPAERRDILADRLPTWTPFPDTNEALTRLKSRFRLGILSNIDRDLFDGTAKHFPMSFDFVITAQDVQSYKPARGHFHRLFESHAELGKTLHVAQSLFHDGEPAQELGLPFVWINRYGEANRSSVNSPTTFVDLKSLADVAGNL